MTLHCNNKITAGGGIYTSRSGMICRFRFFDRHGGVGAVPFNSMNVSHGVGDREKTVFENRRRIQKISACPSLLSAKQVHGDRIYCLTSPIISSREVDSVDALITDQKGVGLMIQQADCQAVLLFDPVKNIGAAVHCGWRGNVINLLGKVVSRMISDYGVSPVNILAAISPSLGPCCAEFVNYKKELPEEFMSFMVQADYFDFWQISQYQLINAGLMDSNITVAGNCTCCSKDYFSYRRSTRMSDGVTGRNCSVIVMDQG
jgi:YfiH family protein